MKRQNRHLSAIGQPTEKPAREYGPGRESAEFRTAVKVILRLPRFVIL